MTLSTHVLDATLGRPAAGVGVVLERRDGAGTWHPVGRGRTGTDGRLADWLPAAEPRPGVHRLVFATGEYFAGRGVPTLYPEVTITFEADGQAGHYHLPLLLSPFAYSTYRGS